MKKIVLLICMTALVISCNNMSQSSAMSAADSTVAAYKAKDSIMARNKATALASVESWSSGKLDDIFKDFAQDGVDYGDGTMAPAKGIDSMKAGAKVFLSAFPDTKGSNFNVIADGNQVAVFGEWSGTFKNPLGKMKPTQKSFKVVDVDLFTFNDAGKITEHHSVQSTATILSQVGAKMK